jgi:hypothetical protein
VPFAASLFSCQALVGKVTPLCLRSFRAPQLTSFWVKFARCFNLQYFLLVIHSDHSRYRRRQRLVTLLFHLPMVFLDHTLRSTNPGVRFVSRPPSWSLLQGTVNDDVGEVGELCGWPQKIRPLIQLSVFVTIVARFRVEMFDRKSEETKFGTSLVRWIELRQEGCCHCPRSLWWQPQEASQRGRRVSL